MLRFDFLGSVENVEDSMLLGSLPRDERGLGMSWSAISHIDGDLSHKRIVTILTCTLLYKEINLMLPSFRAALHSYHSYAAANEFTSFGWSPFSGPRMRTVCIL